MFKSRTSADIRMWRAAARSWRWRPARLLAAAAPPASPTPVRGARPGLGGGGSSPTGGSAGHPTGGSTATGGSGGTLASGGQSGAPATGGTTAATGGAGGTAGAGGAAAGAWRQRRGGRSGRDRRRAHRDAALFGALEHPERPARDDRQQRQLRHRAIHRHRHHGQVRHVGQRQLGPADRRVERRRRHHLERRRGEVDAVDGQQPLVGDAHDHPDRARVSTRTRTAGRRRSPPASRSWGST